MREGTECNGERCSNQLPVWLCPSSRTGGVASRVGGMCSRAGFGGPVCADLAVHRPVSNGEFGGRASWCEGLPGDECIVRDL